MEKEEGQISNLTHYYKLFRLRNSWEVSMQLPWPVGLLAVPASRAKEKEAEQTLRPKKPLFRMG